MSTDQQLPKVIEYSNPLAKSHASRARTLDTKTAYLGNFGNPVTLTLSHHSAGYAIAGSAMRLDPERFKVTWESSRGTEGRAFTSKQEALEYFEEFPALSIGQLVEWRGFRCMMLGTVQSVDSLGVKVVRCDGSTVFRKKPGHLYPVAKERLEAHLKSGQWHFPDSED